MVGQPGWVNKISLAKRRNVEGAGTFPGLHECAVLFETAVLVYQKGDVLAGEEGKGTFMA